MKISELKSGTVPVEIDLDDIVINIVARPRVLTSDYIERYLKEEEVGISVTGDALAAAIETWDITDDDGEMIPISRDMLMSTFRPKDLRKMLEVIANAVLPKAPTKSGSVSTSAAKTAPENI